ncbi:MAG: amino acid adenylation domain-containing protein, partial [Rhodoferax sp.]
DGNIEFLGRIDHQVKMRGFRIELGEIETVLKQVPEVRDAIVLLREDHPGQQRLVAYTTPLSGAVTTAGALRDFLLLKLPVYMVPAAYVLLDDLPLTPNGKIDRKALPPPKDDGGVPGNSLVAPRDAREEMIAQVWCELLHRQQVSVHDNFFDLGGHSLLATQVVARLSRLLQVELPLRTLFEAPSVSALAAALHKMLDSGPAKAITAILPQQRSEGFPLSFSQESLWITDQIYPDRAAYSEPLALRMSGEIDVAALQSAFAVLIERHEPLRTRFIVVEGEARQMIDAAGPVFLQQHDLASLAPRMAESCARDLLQQEARRPFDLARGPLLRVVLIRTAEQVHLLMINLHHIITDGWSTHVLLRELQTLYGAAALPPLPVRYSDFVLRQRQRLKGKQLDSLLDYWRAKLAGLEQLSLPADLPAVEHPSEQGGLELRIVPAELVGPLRAFASRHDATLFTLLLSAFQLLLMRLTGQEDVAIGAPIAGRAESELEGLIGMFVNVVVLRTDLSGDPTFEQLLVRARQTTLDAMAHQEMPFDRLVATLNPSRSLNQNPLFDVMINYVSGARPSLELPGVLAQQEELQSPSAKFALALYISASADAVDLRLVYKTDLFSLQRMDCLLDQFTGLLSQIAASPEQHIRAYSLLTPSDRSWLPDPVALIETPVQQSVVAQVLAWAMRSPGQIAVSCGHGHWTYAELAARSTRLARMFQSRGLGEGDVVAIQGPRGSAMVGAMLAVLMSGAAFLVLDPASPPKRRRSMLNESRAGLICLIAPAVDDGLDPGAQEAVVLRLASDLLEQSGAAGDPDCSTALPLLRGDEPAYVFFTSGSSGRPKGILGCHKSLSHFLGWQRETFAIHPGDRVSQLICLTFDPLLRDVFLPLTSGATLCVPADDDLIDPIAWLKRERVTVVHTSPTVLQSWLREEGRSIELAQLRWLFISGEPLADSLVTRWRSQVSGPARLVNLYGPTETTMARCFYPIPEVVRPGMQAIGTAIANSQLLLLNSGGAICGVGEIGEIVIRTPFCSLGYLNLPEESKRSFRPNPFRGDSHDIVYFTGDRGRYRLDGILEYFGRVDDQVKIRGVRVELGEVTANLLRHQSVREAIVLARVDRSGQRQLVAYVVCGRECDASARVLAGYLRQWLPDTFIPASFVFLQALPQLPNGKIDRKGLPAPRDEDS